MSTTAPSQYQILIDIRARLDAITKVQEQLRATVEAAHSVSALFEEGLGVGTGMELARRSVEFFREAISEAIGRSSQLAAEAERADKRLGLSAGGYQTLAKEAREAQTDFTELLSGMNAYRQKLGEVLLDPTKGSVFTQLNLDAQELARIPLDEQMERTAVSLGKVGDQSVRARMQQELFGRNAAAMTPVLERLRTEGLDALKRSAQDTGSILNEHVVTALNNANTAAEQARARLGIALAPLNLQLQQAKASGLNFLANNAGSITSGINSGFVAAMAASLDKGLVSAAEKVEKMGGWKAAFKNLGSVLAGPIGIAIATFLASYIIKEIERRNLEADARVNAFDDTWHRQVSSVINQQLPNVQTDDDVRNVYNSAVTAYQKAMIERKQRARTASSNEDKEIVASLDREIAAYAALIPFIKERGRAYAEANAAAKASAPDFKRLAEDQTDLFVLDANHRNFQARNDKTESEKRHEESTFLINKKRLLEDILELTEKLPLKETDTKETREQELNKLRAEIQSINIAQSNLTPGGGLSEYDQIKAAYDRQRGGFNTDVTSKSLSAGEGVSAGLMQWSTSLGSAGQQIAGSTQQLMSGGISAVSDGLTGLITKTKSWGDLFRSVGMLALQTLVQLGVQMSVQAALHALMETKQTAATVTGAAARTGARAGETAAQITGTATVVGVHTTAEAVKTGVTVGGAAVRTAANVTETATTTATTTAGAAVQAQATGIAGVFRSIMELGPILGPVVFGASVIGMIALISKLVGHAQGGYTADVGRSEPAGIVHGGEWVAPAWQVEHPIYGPMIAGLEGARTGSGGLSGLTSRGAPVLAAQARSYVVPAETAAASAVAAQAPVSASAARGGSEGGSSRMLQVAFYGPDDRGRLERDLRDPRFETRVVNLMFQNRALFGMKI